MFRLLIRCTRIYQNYCTPTNSTTSYNLRTTLICFKQSHRNHFKRSSINIEDGSGHVSNDVKTEDTKQRFIKLLQTELNCSKHRASQLFCNFSNITDKLADMDQNVKLLLGKGVTSKSILDNLSMLTQNTDVLNLNLRTLEEMKPKNINDFAPLLVISPKELTKIKEITEDEKDKIPHKHRIYYFSHMMNIEPSLISQAASRRLFIFEIPYEKINQNLTVLLQYIDPKDILSDLWVFQYSSAVIENRLMQAKMGHIIRLRPWIIRCPNDTLLKSIKISSDRKALLGEDLLVEYLSNRLQIDISTVEAMLRKYPRARVVNVPKMEAVLDYLLYEVGCSPSDIVKVPRILCNSLKTTKERLHELQTNGCWPTSLTHVCKDSKTYRKYLDNKIKALKRQNDDVDD